MSENKKSVLVLFGGVTPEHEVSVITGTQVVENIDTAKYIPYALLVTKKGEPLLLENYTKRKQFFTCKRKQVQFGRDVKGGFFIYGGKKVYPQASYLAFHGGGGESGSIQGFMDTLGIPYTSSSVEGSAISMNKQITKDVAVLGNVTVVPGCSYFSSDIMSRVSEIAEEIKNKLQLPVIIKPVHLGSSIGIKVAKTEVELEKGLLTASYVDDEVMVEKYLANFVEYNVSVKCVDGKYICSEIEKPQSKDEILSFADKYQRGGGKKTGGANGMASLDRELPAKITSELRDKIQQSAIAAFKECRCKGLVRIDFMYTEDGMLYLTEVNPIPGSMAFYLWESTGMQFRDQITQLLEQSIVDYQNRTSTEFDYSTDIVEKFVKN